ncbi:uncharacterized protein LOC105777660 [Gossypium raimondii]|uniref:uncharacterized protein LOC105777660 n=1 Tax=Gossypium raimondii TaxID=29730 RepID=UPI00227BB4B1|nr:uncharacterized protein LOC105777660 [Gossypium raimondii]
MPLQSDSIQTLLHEKAVIAIPCPHIRLAIPSGSLFPFSNFCPPSSSPLLSCHISDFLIHLLPQISMVLEATMICIDNSEWMRNDDYSLSRFQAQADAISLICGAKTQVK